MTWRRPAIKSGLPVINVVRAPNVNRPDALKEALRIMPEDPERKT
jgi:hypothetical protein